MNKTDAKTFVKRFIGEVMGLNVASKYIDIITYEYADCITFVAFEIMGKPRLKYVIDARNSYVYKFDIMSDNTEMFTQRVFTIPRNEVNI